LQYGIRIRGEESWLDLSEIFDHVSGGSIIDKVKEYESKFTGEEERTNKGKIG